MAAVLLRELAPGAATAGEMSLGFAYDRTYTDNVHLTATDPTMDLINSARVGLHYIDNTPDVNIHANGQVEYRDYVRNSQPDGTFGAVNAAAIWHVDPRRLDWTFEDYFGQVPRVTSGANTQQNRQNINVFATGPNVYLHVDPLNTIELAGRYANHYFQVTDTDNHRLLGEARWIHLMTSRTDLSLNYQTLIVNYGLHADSNYVRTEIFGRARTRPGRSEYSLDLGTNFVTPNGRDVVVGALARVNMRRQISERATLQLQAANEYSDSDRDYVAAAAGGGGTATNFDIASGGFYYGRRVSASYAKSYAYGADILNLYWRNIDYVLGNQDQRAAGGDFAIGFDTGPLLTPYLLGSFTETRYTNLLFVDRDSRYGARLNYRAKRRSYIQLEYTHNRRQSTDATRAYDENRWMFTFGYLRTTATSF